MTPKKKPEYVEGREALENFERALDAVVKVPRAEIKAKLDAEKRDKVERPRRTKPKEQPH
jgi:hypothetical protein